MKRSLLVFGLGLTAACFALQAQSPTIPFDELERDSQPSPDATTRLVAYSTSDGSSTSVASPATTLVTLPNESTMEPHVADRGFFFLNGLHLGMAVLDITMTQRCIARHTCREGNPLMPSTMAGQFGVTLGLFAYSAGGSYYLKKRPSKIWWVLPITGMAAHSVGVASGFAQK